MTKDSINKPLTDTESKILQAAEHEFMSKGFAGARTTSIAESAGVTHAMFHYYFRTKEKLFEKIISEKMEMLVDIIYKSLGDMTMPLEEMIHNLIDQHLDFISKNPELPRFLICEVFNNSERLAMFSKKIIEVAPNILNRLQQKIDSLANEGKCRRVDSRTLMLDIVSLNIFPFVATPFINIVLDKITSDAGAFLKSRKKDNYDTIMRKLALS